MFPFWEPGKDINTLDFLKFQPKYVRKRDLSGWIVNADAARHQIFSFFLVADKEEIF